MKTITLLFTMCLFAVLLSTSCMNNASTATSGTDTLAQNKAVATRVEMAFDNVDTAAIDSSIADDAVDHQMPPNMPGTIKQQLNSLMRMFKAAFPDEKTEIKAMTAEGNLVSVYVTISGTNSGSFMGMPASNKALSFDGADVFKFKNGKVTEHWGVLDMSPIMMAADSAKMMKKDKK